MILDKNDLSKIKLEDDDQERGGISYVGEDALNFCYEAFDSFKGQIPLRKLNIALQECGIQQVKM